VSLEEPKAVSPKTEFLDGLREQISDPIHKRLLNAYAGPDPVASMEGELASVLLEVMRDEN
jgi:hypothetical protein